MSVTTFLPTQVGLSGGCFLSERERKNSQKWDALCLLLSLLLVRFFPLSEGDLDHFPLAWFARRSQGGWMVYGYEKKSLPLFHLHPSGCRGVGVGPAPFSFSLPVMWHGS